MTLVGASGVVVSGVLANEPPLVVTLEDDVLRVRFAERCRTLSWAVHNGGFRTASAVAWVGVRNAELPVGMDPGELLRERLRARGLDHAVGLLTSRALRHFVVEHATHGESAAVCVATVGLSNALRAGDPPMPSPRAGTINVLCWTRTPLGELGLLEALSIAAEARTAAVMEARIPSRVSGAPATGTGTDCIVVACPARKRLTDYAGKHTEVGHVVGDAVLRAVRRGVSDWLAQRGEPTPRPGGA